MKKFYVLIILLVSGSGFGQVNLTGNSNYVLSCSYSLGDARDGCGFGGLQWLQLVHKGGQTPYLKPDDGDTWHNTSGTFSDFTFTESNPVINFKIRSTKRKKNRAGACSTEHERLAELYIQRQETKSYVDMVEDGGALAFSGTITMTTYPVINLINPDTNNNIIGTESKIVINPIGGVLEEYFNWMYHIEGEQTRVRVGIRWVYRDTWRSLPAIYQNKNSLNIDCKNFLPYEAVGKKIWLRANTNGSTVELNYARSAPHILSVEKIQTSCFDSKDGKIKINFSRALEIGETLSLDFDGVNSTDVSNITRDGIFEGKKFESDNSYTVGDLSKGLSTLRLLGFYKQGIYEANTYVMDPEHQASFEITSPKPVDFSLTKKNDINCYGGSDGAIDVVATGGSDNGIYQYSTNGGTNWITFLNGDKTTITQLALGTYYVKVRKLKNLSDAVGCIAKKSDDTEKVLSETIEQPNAPLTLSSDIIATNPTFYKAENGSIIASIKGGTLIDGNHYLYEWRDDKKSLIDMSKSSAVFFNGIFTITLHDVPEGTYRLSVTDQRNCILDSSITPSLKVVLDDPELIVITIEQTQAISCNTENHDPITGNLNKLSDGILKATVSGGVKFTGAANNGLPYKFIWSKYNSGTNVWDALTDYKTDTAGNLSKGNYSLNIIDANGIVQGTYSTTDLVTAIPTTKEIVEPEKLVLSFTSGNVSCHDGNNGWATATVTGGAGSYTYTWYNTGNGIIDKNKIAQLTVGEYFVEVTDAKGCFTKGSVIITEPSEEVKIDYKEIFTPTFSGATNGRIIAKITGGTPKDDQSYNYEWKNAAGVLQTAAAVLENGIYIITLNGVPADDYFLTIKDKNYNEATSQIVNCSVLESKVTLNEPDPLKVVFEIVRTISCNTSNEFGKDTDTTPKDGQRDESQDGILVAHVSGGTPLASSVNNGLPYYFYWKKQQADNTWAPLVAIKGETASNLSHGNYALNIKDRNGIMLGTYVNNVLTQEIDVTQLMQEPPKLSVAITKGDVFCNEGNDGWAAAAAVGGTTPYQYSWSNGETVAENTILTAGNYSVTINDDKKCIVKDKVTISEPTAPISLNYITVLNPSFYKGTNGKIVVEVKGGTPFADKSYGYEWKNSAGVIQTATAQVNNGIYTISLNGLPEETYSLTVRDANYNPATNKTSCTVANSVTALDDPDPLEVTFEVVRTISCHVGNEFGNETDANPLDNQRDESEDGILKAHVKGGIQLAASKNSGLPYFYTWKKQQKDGSWVLWNDHDETAENISDGTYALNIEDANGIKLGTYVNNQLTKEIDVTKLMPQPAKLSVTFTKFDVGCTTGDDGWAEAHVSGGTPPYTYEWTNGETTSKIENITANNYFVIATDAKGCTVQGSIFVGDPKGIFTTETVKNTTCNKGNDAAIQLNVTGGSLPYSYLWNTGAATKDLNNLPAGTYEVAISCPDCCVYKKNFVLKDPEPVIVNIGNDRTLCNDQNLDLEAKIADPKAQYSWTSTNGFTSDEATVKVSKAGTYHVKVTSGLGCIGEDEIVIKTSKAAISSEFLLSSQAYLDEEVILINTSDPFGEGTNWIIPKGVKIVEQKEKYITLKFDATGVYSIGLQQTQGECYAVYSKNITVEQRATLPNTDTATQFIVDFIVTPNPSNGNFKAIITLENNSAVNLRLFSTTGQNTMIQKNESGKKHYEIDFETTLGSGMYVLVLETGQQTLVKKIIIY